MTESTAMTSEDQVFHTSKLKWLAVLAICVAFSVGGYFMIHDPKANSIKVLFGGYLCMLFFGPGALVAVAALLPGSSYLRVGVDGFTTCSLWRRHSYSWSDISHFGLTSVPAGPSSKKMIGFSFVANSPRRSKSTSLRALNTQISGFEAALPDDYGQGYERLLTILEQRLVAYRSRVESQINV
jgi:hypothetical protein